jgi:hypothetical protein
MKQFNDMLGVFISARKLDLICEFQVAFCSVSGYIIHISQSNIMMLRDDMWSAFRGSLLQG